MKDNYPIEQQNQHEHLKLSYEEYTVASDELHARTASDDLLVDVEIEMSRGVKDMRREFNRTTKRLKSFFIYQEPKVSVYKVGYTYPELHFHFAKRRAMG